VKIVHTADWHLCDRLNRLDRTPELRERVERVAEYCEAHQADVLVVAGDLFYERADAAEIAESLRHVHRTFQPFFARGGTVLAITGNHDDDAKIELVRAGLSLAAPVPPGAVLPRGRMYLQNGTRSPAGCRTCSTSRRSTSTSPPCSWPTSTSAGRT
jgi:exonuclease SbcD